MARPWFLNRNKKQDFLLNNRIRRPGELEISSIFQGEQAFRIDIFSPVFSVNLLPNAETAPDAPKFYSGVSPGRLDTVFGLWIRSVC